MSEVDWWRGTHGDEYTRRNSDLDLEARAMLWDEILDCLADTPETFLEIGAGTGRNLLALKSIGHEKIWGVEPNALAGKEAMDSGLVVHGGTAASPGLSGDLVFTSGVLIHIPPDELLDACKGIYGAAERYIACIEYFSAEPEEKPYRGRRLWKRDFGSFWLDNFDLRVMGCGFAWKRTTGLDNVTWWVFAK